MWTLRDNPGQAQAPNRGVRAGRSDFVVELIRLSLLIVIIVGGGLVGLTLSHHYHNRTPRASPDQKSP
mgnify:CR=1 FL=1